jgi:hypothetical protein
MGNHWQPGATRGNQGRPVAPVFARIPCTTVPSTKATQNATQVVALSTLAGPPGPSRSCYVLRVRVFDDQWRPLATTGNQWRGCSVRAHTLPGTTTLLEHPIRLRRTKVKRGCLLRRLWGRLIVSKFGVCPPSASTKWRRSSVRDHTSVHASGRPWVAHGRPWSPIGTRGCQGVPGVLASMGDHGRPGATRGDQWRRSSVRALPTRQVHASGRQRSPMVAHGRPSVPESARGCQGVLASMGDHGRPGATSGDQLSRSSVEVNCRSKQRFFDLTLTLTPPFDLHE